MSEPKSPPSRLHDHARGAIWLLAAAMLAMGLALLFGAPKGAVGVIASGALALLILKHVGLLLVVASPAGPLAQHLRRRRERRNPPPQA